MGEHTQIIELGDSTIRKLAKEVHELNLAEKKRIRDNAYHNTKLLMSNYHLLKAHCDIINEQISGDLLSGIWGDDRFQLSTLMENKAKTSKLMNHVDRALEEFERKNPEGYTMLKMKYLNKNKLSDVDISVAYGTERSVVTKKLKHHLRQLSIILFGAEVIIADF
ncbi:hypothetical protein [Enterococcus sp. BWR-S5]|uniref:hypothetical protein n=1 Tax=Enterococcus sp. BWR-S5 TaxID=2787714 RepID=UPI00192274A3|nr:hypothetical protein [Enterococcus sp. BWR-S5]MBL1226595.1 hypothetical protein [Enterococcus sp. BWR-S5]